MLNKYLQKFASVGAKLNKKYSKASIIIIGSVFTLSVFASVDLGQYGASQIVDAIRQDCGSKSTPAAQTACINDVQRILDINDASIGAIRSLYNSLSTTTAADRMAFFVREGGNATIGSNGTITVTPTSNLTFSWIYGGATSYTYTVTNTTTDQSVSGGPMTSNVWSTTMGTLGYTENVSLKITMKGCKSNNTCSESSIFILVYKDAADATGALAAFTATQMEGGAVNIPGFGAAKCWNNHSMTLGEQYATAGGYAHRDLLSILKIANDPTLPNGAQDWWYCITADTKASPVLYSVSQGRTCLPSRDDLQCFEKSGTSVKPGTQTVKPLGAGIAIPQTDILRGATLHFSQLIADSIHGEFNLTARGIFSCSASLTSDPNNTVCKPGTTGDRLTFAQFAAKNKCSTDSMQFILYNAGKAPAGKSGEFVCHQATNGGYMTYKGNIVNMMTAAPLEALGSNHVTCGLMTEAIDGLTSIMSPIFWASNGAAQIPDPTVIGQMDVQFCKDFVRKVKWEKAMDSLFAGFGYSRLAGKDTSFVDTANWCEQNAGKVANSCNYPHAAEKVLNAITPSMCADTPEQRDKIAEISLYCTRFDISGGSITLYGCVESIAQQLVNKCRMTPLEATGRMCFGQASIADYSIQGPAFTNLLKSKRWFCSTSYSKPDGSDFGLSAKGGYGGIDMEYVKDRNASSTNPLDTTPSKIEICSYNPSLTDTSNGQNLGYMLNMMGNYLPVYNSIHCGENDPQYRAIRNAGCAYEQIKYLKYVNNPAKGELLCEGMQKITKGNTVVSLQDFYNGGGDTDGGAAAFPKVIELKNTPLGENNALGTKTLICWNKQGMIDGNTASNSNGPFIDRLTYASNLAWSTTTDWWYCTDNETKSKNFLWDNNTNGGRSCLLENNDNCYKGIGAPAPTPTATATPVPGGPVWQHIAADGTQQLIQVTGTQKLRFGSGDRWIERTVTNDTIICGTEYFGNNPAPGTQMSCEWLQTNDAPPIKVDAPAIEPIDIR